MFQVFIVELWPFVTFNKPFYIGTISIWSYILELVGQSSMKIVMSVDVDYGYKNDAQKILP